MSSTTNRLRANREASDYVIERLPFVGSSLRGVNYTIGGAPHFSPRDTWLDAYEREQYAARRASVTYIVYSFATPIAYYCSEGEHTGWYKVGQVFSSYTSRHQYAALHEVPGHQISLTGTRGDWTVTCSDCDTVRHFTRAPDADRAFYTHR